MFPPRALVCRTDSAGLSRAARHRLPCAAHSGLLSKGIRSTVLVQSGTVGACARHGRAAYTGAIAAEACGLSLQPERRFEARGTWGSGCAVSDAAAGVVPARLFAAYRTAISEANAVLAARAPTLVSVEHPRMSARCDSMPGRASIADSRAISHCCRGKQPSPLVTPMPPTAILAFAARVLR